MADNPAAFFTEMASRLGRINQDEFAGAAVIVPKDGEPVVIMLVDPSPPAAEFWTVVGSRVEIAAVEAKQAEQDANGMPGYGGRR